MDLSKKFVEEFVAVKNDIYILEAIMDRDVLQKCFPLMSGKY